MMVVIAAELAARVSGVRLIQDLAWIAMGAVVLLSWRRLGVREVYLLVLSVSLAVAILLLDPQPARSLAAALDQASFLMVFILLLGMLHEVASSSPSIAACGEYLTRQPPGRRYYGLNLGSAFLAVLFNVGVISFLVPLVQKGIERGTPGDALNPIRERRQVSALLRGFAWSVIWSPTALAPLAVAELIPGTDRNIWMLYGFCLFLVVLVIGGLEDRWRFRTYRPANKTVLARFPKIAFFYFLAACAWLLGMTAGFVWLTGEGVVFGLLMACPLMVAGWLVAQYGARNKRGIVRVRGRMRIILGTGLANSAQVAIMLGCSGFVGRAAAALVPAQAIATWLRLDAMPDFVLLSLIPLAITMLSMLALSPIVMAVFFGSLFGALPVLPADPTLIAFSISCGWALSMTFSPFATVVLLIERVSGLPSRRMTWGWNFTFTTLCIALLPLMFALLTGGR